MSKLTIGSITVIVNGYTINNGVPYYQRAIPASLRPRFGKSTIKISLRKEKRNHALVCHRLWQGHTSLFAAMQCDSSLTPPEKKIAALELLQLVGLSEGDGTNQVTYVDHQGRTETFQPEQDVLHDYLVHNDFKPSELTSNAFKALRGELPVLLSEAFSVYLDNHLKRNDRKFAESQKQHWDKLISLNGDVALESINRKVAVQYRDARLATGVTAATVKREINTLRAVFASAKRELSLTVQNPFESLTVPEGVKQSTQRLPFSREQFSEIVKEAINADDERRRAVVLLAFTGARLSEILGLRNEDVDLTTKVIRIYPHSERSLKNQKSIRNIPLVPTAFLALEKQFKDSNGTFLFPTYASSKGVNSDSASATLNKWLKKVNNDGVVHQLRHTMRDALRAVQCPDSIAKSIGGWSSSQDVSESYGLGYPLDVKLEWLNKAYSFLKIS